jgi:hypothetical protein
MALASQPVKAQTGATDFVVVKLIEYTASVDAFIARPGSKPERREYKPKDLRELGDGLETSGAAEVTRRLLVELAQQGYSLTTTYSSAAQTGPTTLIFTKKP